MQSVLDHVFAEDSGSLNSKLGELSIDSWQAIDLVLCQEILAKLELLAPAEVDEELRERLVSWTRGPGTALVEFSRRLQIWSEREPVPGVVPV